MFFCGSPITFDVVLPLFLRIFDMVLGMVLVIYWVWFSCWFSVVLVQILLVFVVSSICVFLPPLPYVSSLLRLPLVYPNFISPLHPVSPSPLPSPVPYQSPINMDDEECSRLPKDFDINVSIDSLTDMIMKRVPLVMYFYHLIKRLEEEASISHGRT